MDGTAYEIDLSATHDVALRADLPFEWPLPAAPPRGTVGTGWISPPAAVAPDRTPGRAVGNSERTTAFRVWPRDSNYEVSARGRIPIAVRQAFNVAHGPPPVWVRLRRSGHEYGPSDHSWSTFDLGRAGAGSNWPLWPVVSTPTASRSSVSFSLPPP